MAANSKAIGLLFEVAGEGNINGETGKRINGQLRNLVGAINKSDTIKLKFTVDANHFKKEIDLIKQQLQNVNLTSGSNKGGSSAGKASKHTEGWKKATAAVTEYYKLLTQVRQALTRTDRIIDNEDGTFDVFGKTEEEKKRWKDLVEQVNQAKESMDLYTEASAKANMTLEEQAILTSRISDEKAKLSIKQQAFEATGQQAWSNLTAKVHDYISRVEISAQRDEEAMFMLQKLREMANSADWRGYDALKEKLGEVQSYINKNSLATETWSQKLSKTFGTRIRSLVAGILAGKLAQYLRDIYNNVVEIDSAMTQLRIVTGASDSQMTKFLSNSIRLSKELGASVKDVLSSVETFTRLGYGISEATVLSKYATIMSKVADVSAEDANKGITSILKGYGFDPSQSEHISDVLIEVGQKYAVSASELMDAYSRAGAALNATNTSFEKSAGLIAAANASVQDASVVGTALKTVSARIRKSKTDLDDLGESVDDITQSWSAYAEEIKVLTGFDIMVEGSTTKFKDLYDIFDGLAKVWNDLGDNAETTQARVAEILGGTKQYQVISSILTNWGDAAGAYRDAMDSAGVTTKAVGEYVDSIQGRLASLDAAFVEFSQNVLNSELIKGGVSFLNSVVNLLTGISGVGNGVVVGILAWAAAILLVNAAFHAGNLAIKKAIIHYATLAGVQVEGTITTEIFKASLKEFATTGLMGVILTIPRFIIAIFKYIAAAKAGTGATLTFKGALDALKVNPIILAVEAIVAAGAIAIAVANKCANAALDASDAAKEHAQSLQEAAEKAKEESDTLDELIERYEQIRAKGEISVDTRKEIRDIQKQINKLTNGEASSWDMVNDNLGDTLDKLKKYRIEKAKNYVETSKNAYDAAKNSSNLAYVRDTSDAGIVQWATNWVGTDVVAKGGDEAAVKILKKVSGVTEAWNNSNITGLRFDAKGAQEYIDVISRAMDALESDVDYDYHNSAIWGKLSSIKTAYEEFTSSAKESSSQLLDNVVELNGLTFELSGRTVDSIESYQDFKTSMYEAALSSEYLKDAISSQLITQNDLRQAVEDYMATNFPEWYEKFAASFTKASAVAKTFLQILNELQGQYDALTKAIDDMNQYGYLSADTLSELLDPEKGYPGLVKYLTMTANGYTITSDAIEQFIREQQESYVQALAVTKEGTEAYEVAYQNLANFLAVVATLKLSTQLEKEKKALEGQKTAWNDQLDNYKELIDLRKKLLETYADELEYQKQLEKKQRDVIKLQTKLSVARLDKSAAGQARVRELEEQLTTAQDELNDFTLDHAIDVLTDQLDDQYQEYEAFINMKVDSITDAIDNISKTIRDSAVTTGDQIAKLLAEYLQDHPETKPAEKPAKSQKEKAAEAVQAVQDYVTSHKLREADRGLWGQIPELKSLMTKALAEGGDLSTVHGTSDTPWTGKDDVPSGSLSGQIDTDKAIENSYRDLIKTTSNAAEKTDKKTDFFWGTRDKKMALAEYCEKAIVDSNGDTFYPWLVLSNGKKYYLKLGEGYDFQRIGAEGTVKIKGNSPYYNVYHTGGFVGGITNLNSNEEFAKLLKGEFVSTPAQMRQFMQRTLPEIAKYPSTQGNEFNAPLVEITCESVTTEALPGLKEIANEAAAIIKKQLDSGMSRNGFKKTFAKRLT